MEVLSTKAQHVYVDSENHTYVRVRERVQKNARLSYLRCRNKSCAGSAKVKEGEQMVLITPHNHEADVAAVDRLRFKHRLWHRAAHDTQPLQHIYKQECDRSGMEMKQWKSVCKTLYRARNMARPPVHTIQQLAHTLDDDQWKNKFINTIDEKQQQFYRKTIKSEDETYCAVWLSPTLENVARNSSSLRIYADTHKFAKYGTQDSKNSSTIIVFHIYVQNTTYPFLFALAERKTSAVYISILTYLKNIIHKDKISFESHDENLYRTSCVIFDNDAIHQPKTENDEFQIFRRNFRNNVACHINVWSLIEALQNLEYETVSNFLCSRNIACAKRIDCVSDVPPIFIGKWIPPVHEYERHHRDENCADAQTQVVKTTREISTQVNLIGDVNFLENIKRGLPKKFNDEIKIENSPKKSSPILNFSPATDEIKNPKTTKIYKYPTIVNSPNLNFSPKMQREGDTVKILNFVSDSPILNMSPNGQGDFLSKESLLDNSPVLEDSPQIKQNSPKVVNNFGINYSPILIPSPNFENNVFTTKGSPILNDLNKIDQVLVGSSLKNKNNVDINSSTLNSPNLIVDNVETDYKPVSNSPKINNFGINAIDNSESAKVKHILGQSDTNSPEGKTFPTLKINSKIVKVDRPTKNDVNSPIKYIYLSMNKIASPTSVVSPKKKVIINLNNPKNQISTKETISLKKVYLSKQNNSPKRAEKSKFVKIDAKQFAILKEKGCVNPTDANRPKKSTNPLQRKVLILEKGCVILNNKLSTNNIEKVDTRKRNADVSCQDVDIGPTVDNPMKKIKNCKIVDYVDTISQKGDSYMENVDNCIEIANYVDRLQKVESCMKPDDILARNINICGEVDNVETTQNVDTMQKDCG